MAVPGLVSPITLAGGEAHPNELRVQSCFASCQARAMSHSSGIPVSEALSSAWGDARTNGEVRFLKIVITNDQLVHTHTQKLTPSFDDDYKQIAQHLQPKTPCYVAFRLDSYAYIVLDILFTHPLLQQEHERPRVAPARIHSGRF